jgi:PAS domain S-box-containing protein
MPLDKLQQASSPASALPASEEGDLASSPCYRAADAVPAYISYVDDQLRYVYVNRTYEKTFNRPLSEIIGHLVSEVVGPAYEEIGPNLHAALAGERRHFEPRFGVPPNERIVSVDQIPDLDASGRVRGIIAYGHDITDIRRAEAALQASEERLRMALSATRSVGFWDWDVANDLVFAGAKFATLYGVDPDVAESGMKVAEFIRNIHPDDVERVGADIQRAITKGGGEFSSEYRLLQKDGYITWVLAVGRCTFDAHGTPTRFPGVSVDITDRKRREDALIQSEKLAAVGRLASSIAHEINNPLEAVTNLIFLARQRSVVPEVQEYLEAADLELRRVSAIANQTLRFHKQSSLPQAIGARELFATVLALFEGRLKNCGAVIETSYRAKQLVSCFEGDIRQVLNNLVGNALDAIGQNGHLIIRSNDTVDWATDRRGMVLTVADNGVGMPAEVVENIFEPFFTTKGVAGTGLGMWVSKEVVDRHRGTLRVRSSQHADHHGSVFRFFLPYTN